jgi:branched-chain amino acid transport system ATP-binding protein
MAENSVLRAQDLSKRFGGVVAADGVDVAVGDGELRCIIGPNGAGKSTLFQLLCGIYRPDRGSVLYRDQDITGMPAFRRARLGIGMTFQQNRAFHNLTVQQNLDAPMTLAASGADDKAKGRFRDALEAFDLARHSDEPARELPHHKLQWLEIAMVLASGPSVLLLDEPTAGMSPEETKQTAEVLRGLNRDGLTIVVVEHDIAFVREVAQLVTVLHQGKVFAEGSVADITAHADVRKIYLGKV